MTTPAARRSSRVRAIVFVTEAPLAPTDLPAGSPARGWPPRFLRLVAAAPERHQLLFRLCLWQGQRLLAGKWRRWSEEEVAAAMAGVQT